jgi:hypothetical protein
VRLASGACFAAAATFEQVWWLLDVTPWFVSGRCESHDRPSGRGGDSVKGKKAQAMAGSACNRFVGWFESYKIPAQMLF